MNLTFGPPPEPREWMRADPAYDEPGPLSTADLRQMLRDVPAAVVFVIGAIVGMGFFIVAFTPKP